MGKSNKIKKHTFILQVTDLTTIPIDNTDFSVTVDVVKTGKQVTLFFPVINFQIGQISEFFAPYVPYPGTGLIVTTKGFLPECLKHQSITPISKLVSAGDGFVPIATFSGPFPTPPSGYTVLLDSEGCLTISQAGAQFNQISPGSHTLFPFSMTYLASKKKKITECEHILSKGFTDVTQFTGNGSPYRSPQGDNIRDSHINDFYDGIQASAWPDNHNIPKTQNTLSQLIEKIKRIL
jgi:hypothetical protein